MMTDHPRVVLIDEPEYIASYHVKDLGDGKVMTFFHLDVFYFSPEVYKRMKKHWEIILKAFPIKWFCMFDDETPATRKFAQRFGWKVVSDIPCDDGRTRTLYSHFPELPPQSEA